MSVPSAPVAWYQRYFTEDYWAYADAEYTDQRTDAEVDYLASVLTRFAPGRRVLDLGCGCGRHAIGLARRGFDVVGLDVSAAALHRAKLAAEAAGVRVTWRRADLLASADWGLDMADAAVCVQAFGWGTDDDQLRLLRAVRRLLPDDGVLVLDHSSILAITRNYRFEDRADIAGASFHFVRRYDPVTGRSGGDVRIRRADGSTVVLPDNVRLYHPTEVADLLVRAGFEVSAVDADFTAGAPVTLDTRYVQFTAVPAKLPGSALAAHRDSLPDGVLDLRWAPDEADFVAGALAAAWTEIGPAPCLSIQDRACRYDLSDPYGGGRAATVLGPHLGWPAGGEPAADRVTVGAGATGLLHDLARLADGGTVLVDPVGHPELAVAAAATGTRVRVAALAEPAAAIAAVQRHRPAITVLDRPGVVGRRWRPEEVRELAVATVSAAGILVVDEACAGYAGPRDTCARLTDELPGLVVLRSMSKGYCCGGLRVGFAVVSPDLVTRVISVVTPLAAGALSLDLSLALLRQADPLAALRRRIAEVKPHVAALLADAGLTVRATDPCVPWLVLDGGSGTADTLARLGVAGREVPVLRPDGHRATLLRLTVPLSTGRLQAFERALRKAADGARP